MNEIETEELNAYLMNRFTKRIMNPESESESYSDTWELWLESESPCEILNTHIIPKRPVEISCPEEVIVRIQDTFAGRIPLVILGNDSDFENLIVNAACRGERPHEISEMGASFMYGKRIRMLVLSKKFYSNTPAERVNLSHEEWRDKSMTLRLEHETVHYYTKKFYGTASNNIHDELMADFFGIRKAFGHYDSNLFCDFMSRRLSLYTVGMTENVRNEIADIAVKCSRFLERKQNEIDDAPSGIDYLCELGINGMLEKKYYY